MVSGNVSISFPRYSRPLFSGFVVFGVRAMTFDDLDHWADRIATIKAGIASSLLAGGWGVVAQIDWLAVIGAIVALLTGAAQVVRIWADVRKDRRETKRQDRENQNAK